MEQGVYRDRGRESWKGGVWSEDVGSGVGVSDLKIKSRRFEGFPDERSKSIAPQDDGGSREQSRKAWRS